LITTSISCFVQAAQAPAAAAPWLRDGAAMVHIHMLPQRTFKRVKTLNHHGAFITQHR
jgi:hypothetical protein